MSHIEIKAKELREEAVKKMNPGNFFASLFGGGDRQSQAIDYYTRAGNLFKMAKNWLQAGLVFLDAGNLNFKADNFNEAALNYVEAANCFRKCDVSRAIEIYLKAIQIFAENGRFLTAARYHHEVAEIFEDQRDISGAVSHYEQAADYYRQENNHSTANKLLQKVAEYAALGNNFSKAINIFQQIACFELSTSLTKFHAKEYLFCAALCHLCQDTNVLEKILTKYSEMYPLFKDSREHQLITCLVECIDEGDISGFTNAVRMFNASSKMSMWQINMMSKARSDGRFF